MHRLTAHHSSGVIFGLPVIRPEPFARVHETVGLEDGTAAAVRASWPKQLLSTTFRGAGPRRRYSGHGRRRGFFRPATIEIRRCVQK